MDLAAPSSPKDRTPRPSVLLTRPASPSEGAEIMPYQFTEVQWNPELNAARRVRRRTVFRAPIFGTLPPPTVQSRTVHTARDPSGRQTSAGWIVCGFLIRGARAPSQASHLGVPVAYNGGSRAVSRAPSMLDRSVRGGQEMVANNNPAFDMGAEALHRPRATEPLSIEVPDTYFAAGDAGPPAGEDSGQVAGRRSNHRAGGSGRGSSGQASPLQPRDPNSLHSTPPLSPKLAGPAKLPPGPSAYVALGSRDEEASSNGAKTPVAPPTPSALRSPLLRPDLLRQLGRGMQSPAATRAIARRSVASTARSSVVPPPNRRLASAVARKAEGTGANVLATAKELRSGEGGVIAGALKARRRRIANLAAVVAMTEDGAASQGAMAGAILRSLQDLVSRGLGKDPAKLESLRSKLGHLRSLLSTEDQHHRHSGDDRGPRPSYVDIGPRPSYLAAGSRRPSYLGPRISHLGDQPQGASTRPPAASAAARLRGKIPSKLRGLIGVSQDEFRLQARLGPVSTELLGPRARWLFRWVSAPIGVDEDDAAALAEVWDPCDPLISARAAPKTASDESGRGWRAGGDGTGGATPAAFSFEMSLHRSRLFLRWFDLVIHPLSLIRYIWDSLIALLVIYTALVIPFRLAFYWNTAHWDW